MNESEVEIFPSLKLFVQLSLNSYFPLGKSEQFYIFQDCGTERKEYQLLILTATVVYF